MIRGYIWELGSSEELRTTNQITANTKIHGLVQSAIESKIIKSKQSLQLSHNKSHSSVGTEQNLEVRDETKLPTTIGEE